MKYFDWYNPYSRTFIAIRTNNRYLINKFMFFYRAIKPINRIIPRYYSMNSLKNQYIAGNVPKIELTPTEQDIVKILNSYTNVYNETHTEKPITLRITGGWVRDKLLEHVSHDIDIGIDNCSGEAFVLGLKEWLENKEKDQAGLKIHKIKQNPDKSKHLETCTTKICGLDIDFVNLRSESYTEQSRIPTITTGTAIEDAYRRDATLNAMFFNLNTMEIEDLTGKGLEDLCNGVLRTPLEPRKTFLDDPLRCLRLIRFASNYGFKFDQNTVDAMRDDGLKVALETKISRERIGVEFKKMIINKRGLIGIMNALSLIREVDLSCIFDLGDTKVAPEWTAAHEKQLSVDVLQSIDDILKYVPETNRANVMNIEKYLTGDENDTMALFVSMILAKWGAIRVKVGKQENYASYYCVLNGLKMPAKLAEHVSLIVKSIESTRSGVENIPVKRSDVAKQFVLPFKDKWELNLIINCCLEIFENGDIENCLVKYQKIVELIHQLQLQESHNEQVLLNGKDIMQMYNKKPGSWIKPITEELFSWQLDHPNCSKDEMIEYLKTINIL